MKRFLLVWSMILGSACGPTEENDTHHAPAISNFVYQPNTITTDTDFTIFCSVDYEDAGADIVFFDYLVHFPTGTLFEGEQLEAEGTYGVAEGTADFHTYVHVTVAGDYVEEIWLIDEKGAESNRLEATFTVR